MAADQLSFTAYSSLVKAMTAQSHSFSFGDYNKVTVLYETGEKDFISSPLDRFRPPHFPKLSCTEAIVNKLRKRRLLLLAGDPAISTLPLARHFAWYLSELLPSEAAPGSSRIVIPVLEWKGSGGQTIDGWIERYPDQTIFILPQLLPQYINYDVRKLWRALSDRHYAIATVEEPVRWRQAHEDRILLPFWQALRAVEIYTPRDLVPFLANRMKEAANQLPGALGKAPGGNGVLLGGQRIEAIAEQLKTPENIEDFVRQLCEVARNGRVTSEMVVECIKAAQDDTNRIREWYFRLPGIREQLLALALNFFDGLADTQFFAALDELIEQTWQRRDASLRALDFCDLEPLEKFYDFAPFRGGGQAIKTKLQDQRRRLFEVAWKRHRRHILGALPVFYQCIQQSIEATTENMALYGTKERRDQLRKTLTETISDIGLQDITAVEEWLLRLAIDRRIGVQAVAARVIGRWREYGEREKPLRLLRRWMDDPEIAEMIKGMDSPPGESGEQPVVYLRSTIALAIGFAAQADPPNSMPPILYSLLEELSEGANKRVLTSLSSCTLPMILPLHMEQARNVVETLALHADLHDQLANGLAQACHKQPAEVTEILDGWYRRCLRPSARELGGKRAAKRVALLACTCAAYGRLPYRQIADRLTVEMMLARMQRVLEIENDSTVRQAALSAIIRQARDYFSELQDIVPQVTPDELHEIIRTLVDVYLEQREGLPGGETTFEAAGRYYPTWIDSRRPLTKIEVEMYLWVKDTQNTIAQQIAVRALLAFHHALYQAEREWINRILNNRRRQRSDDDLGRRAVPEVRKIGLHGFDWYLYYVAPFIVTIRAKRYRPIIRGVLPEILWSHEKTPNLLNTVLDEWTDLTDRDMIELGERLPRAITWAYRRWWIIIALAALVVLILVMCGLTASTQR